MLFKLLPILTLLLSSCGTYLVHVKHPLPKFEANQKSFSSDLIGEYVVMDSILNIEMNMYNEVFDPKIELSTDTSYMGIGQSKMIISNKMIVRKSNYTIYVKRVYFDSETRKTPTELDTLIYHGDTVELIFNEDIDTLFSVDRGDIIRLYKNNYVLNLLSDYIEGSYTPILVTKSHRDGLNIMILEENSLLRYYWSFMTDKMDNKADLIQANKPIRLKNSVLEELIRKNYFTLYSAIERMD